MPLEVLTQLPDGNGGLDTVPNNVLCVKGAVEEAFDATQDLEKFTASRELIEIINGKFTEADLIVRAVNQYLQKPETRIEVEGKTIMIQDDLPSEGERKRVGKTGHLLIRVW